MELFYPHYSGFFEESPRTCAIVAPCWASKSQSPLPPRQCTGRGNSTALEIIWQILSRGQLLGHLAVESGDYSPKRGNDYWLPGETIKIIKCKMFEAQSLNFIFDDIHQFVARQYGSWYNHRAWHLAVHVPTRTKDTPEVGGAYHGGFQEGGTPTIPKMDCLVYQDNPIKIDCANTDARYSMKNYVQRLLFMTFQEMESLHFGAHQLSLAVYGTSIKTTRICLP